MVADEGAGTERVWVWLERPGRNDDEYVVDDASASHVTDNYDLRDRYRWVDPSLVARFRRAKAEMLQIFQQIDACPKPMQIVVPEIQIPAEVDADG